MSKITTSKFPDVGKMLATPAGKQLAELIEYMSDLSDDVILNLRNALTFADNFDAAYSTVTLLNNVVSGLQVTKRARMVQVAQVVSTLYGIDAFSWYIDQSGDTKIKASFSGSPPADEQITVVLLIVYG